jgi:ribosomal protein L16 Arg81 hydroxylase
MQVQDWLGELPKAKFLEQHYYRQPCSGRCGSAAILALGTWEVLGAILASPEADTLVVRRNEQRAGAPRSMAEAQSLIGEGYTLLVRHAERHHHGIANLAAAFARELEGPADVHAYITPPDQYGFSWHYDAEEVFILQTTGRKEYSLRKNTVNPWPIEETLPADMHYEREIMPMMKCTLEAGDWLYIPSGWWHKASALPGEAAISLALGVMPRTGILVYDLLRREVLDSLLWRQRLPVKDTPGREAVLRELLEQFATDAPKLFKSEGFYRRLMEEDTPR